MAKHKPFCWVVSLLIAAGTLNWGLVGLGGFMGTDLNVVNMLLGSWPQVEWVVYLLVGLAGLGFVVNFFTGKECSACKM